jgi:hypothetical protein
LRMLHMTCPDARWGIYRNKPRRSHLGACVCGFDGLNYNPRT